MIELINVTKRFGKKVAVNNLNLNIEKGKLTMLIGPSGCGKTTTMRMINRLTQYNEGDIKLNGVSINEINPVKLRRSIGYVIQEIGLFPHFTVYDNIATVPRLLKWDEKKIRKPFWKSPYMLVLPALLFYLIFWAGPVFSAVKEVFTSVDGGFSFDTVFFLFQDDKFLPAFGNTLLFAVVSIVLQFLLALGLALLINRNFKGSSFFLFLMIS